MAERAGAGGGTSLRGMRERMVAAAHAIAEERRSQSGFSTVPSQSSNIRSTFKPVIDGSVLKNDVKQRLAKERREEKKRQQEANKETQLLEKERKSRIQYEKQMEEKQRKLKEQKEKDEQRRISAEEKRKQKLQEERERFKAVLYRTLERSNRVDHRQKRWSWEGSTAMNPETKTANKRSISTEKLEQETSGLHKQMSMSSGGPQNSIAKKKIEKKRSSSLNRRSNKLQAPVETVQIEEKPTGTHNTLIQHMNMPLRSHSSDELKSTTVLRKSAVAGLPREKVEALPKANIEAAPHVTVEATPEASVEAAPEASVEAAPEASVEGSPEGSVEASREAGMEALPESMETSPEVSVDVSLEVSVDPSSLEASVDPSSPEVSVDPSPEVSLDSSPEVSMEASPDVSMEASSEASVEASPEASVKALPKESVEASPKASPEVGTGTSSKVKVRDSPQKSEMDKQASNPATKKRPSSHIPCYKWPSSPASGWRPPSPISVKQMQKNRPPSPSPIMSKQSQSSLSYKIIPVQRSLLTQNALGALGKKREGVPKTANSSEAVSQKQMICEESGNKSTPGTMNAKEATKILAEKRRLAREQREKEERIQKEREQSKVKDVAEKAVEGQQEEFLKVEDEQQQKEIKKKDCPDPEDQKVLLQRIEEIMKRTRKTDSNASKAAEPFVDTTYEEDEADDEDESDSDDGSFDDLHPSAFINGMDSSTKLKTHFKNMKKNTPKLVFLDATSGQVCRETKTFFNGDMKNFRQKSAKDPLAQARGTRSSTKRMTSRAAKTRKICKLGAAQKRIHPLLWISTSRPPNFSASDLNLTTKMTIKNRENRQTP
ncbi:MAP7 domain-containing protein 3 isoform X10 [Ursus arctos]|uniref:MAP7 domain-containing protein 3 isoform X10 n=1 Tax=Ursus arctos TaxID=9644 RepID=UPI002016D62A|nr:MAP7 domain-containing protein 3 isoform X10 [Ursus arctos]